MEETQHNAGSVNQNDLLGNGIGIPDQPLTTTDADVTEPGGSGDLGGGRVGGDLAEPSGSGSDLQGVEDEDLVNDAVDDGADIAAEGAALPDNSS
jgi:hypothetical protein